MRYRLSLLWVLGLVFILAAAACSQPAAQPTVAPTKPAASPTTAAPAPTKPAASPATSSGGTGAPLRAKIGVVGGGTTGGVAMYVAYEKGYYKAEGLDLEFVPFNTGADMIPALAQGQLDAGMGAISAAVFNAIARDINIRLVAEPSNVDHAEGLVVRTDLADKIKDWSDLKGKKFALSGTGSAVEINVEAALKQGGLTEKDIDITTMGFPDMLPAMANKAVDVAYIVEPLRSQGIANKLFVPFKDAGVMNPNHQVGVLMYSGKFATANPDAGKAFMVATIKGARDFYEFTQTGKDKQFIIDASIKNTSVKDPKAYDNIVWPGMNPDMAMQPDSVKRDLDWYVQRGLVKDAPDLSKAIDTSFQKYALDKLGPYKR